MAWLWPHTVGGARFEARRAVANLTHGLRRSSPASFSGEPTADEVLVFLEAAHNFEKAVNDMLREIATEARRRGATWAEIGERVGGRGKTAAQKRFGSGLDEMSQLLLTVEGTSLNLAMSILLDALPEGVPRPLSQEDWDAAPPEVAVPHAVRNMPSALEHLNSAIEGSSIDVKALHAGLEALRRSANILLSPEALTAVESCLPIDREPWRDENPTTYFVHAACLAFSSFVCFSKFVKSAEMGLGEKEREDHYVMGLIYLQEAITATVRPECVAVMNSLDERASEGGHAVYRKKFPDIDPSYLQSGIEAYWRGDRKELERLDQLVREQMRRGNRRSEGSKRDE
ncbi:hypothetical protein ADL15_26820 [Actinoplanes awajinensis subsp. mycoplanecinus]|uniref:Uncharacterized protein n=1 Tax=Actinoplanes awajinensis subsp. mycoplanecinus TaxID=135947 RepID=A0A117MQ71_9ACTN|nr:hypothetical protein ADL15_26820 [Actinoplanes awajinensis subsp. mycoplanecinus]